MMPFIWLAVIVLIIVVEATTMGLVSVWFLPGAFVALVLAAFDLPLWLQITVFVVLAVVMLFLGRKIFRPFNKKVKTNADALIGQTALITEQVDNVRAMGAAKIGGREWSARAEDPTQSLQVGDLVTVVAIEGVKLICRK